jgi:hypothetical protein
VNPGGGSGWDEPPLDIQIPDDARELDREVLAYHREMRAQRRRNRLRRLAGPLAGQGTLMPLLASILAVCLVAGAMLSVATFSPATAPGNGQTARPGTSAPTTHSAPQSTAPARPSAATSAGTGSARTSPAATGSARTSPTATGSARTSPAATSRTATTPAATSRASGSADPLASPARPSFTG